MPTDLTIRPETPRDHEAIHAVNLAAFAGDAEANLVDQLRGSEAFIPRLSLVAETGGRIVGHLLMTHAAVAGAAGDMPALALAPMSVLPDEQGRGVGSMLVRRGLADAAALRHRLVIVLGHPKYYPRFGFVRASQFGIRAPFPAPDEALMALWLHGTKPRKLNGMVRYAAPFCAPDAK